MGEGLLVDIVVVEVALLATSLLVLIGHAVALAARERRQRPQLAQAARSLRATLEGTPLDRDDLAALARLRTNGQIAALGDLSTSLGGGDKHRLAQVAADLGLLEKAERWCSSRRWGTRLRGARVFTVLGGGETVVPRMFSDRRPEVRAQAAQWAGDHPESDSIDHLLSMLADPETLCRFTVKDSLLRVGHAAAEPLLRSLVKNPTPEALEVAAGIGDARFLGPALQCCRSSDARTRALAAILIGSIGGTQATDALSDLLRDRDLNVRAAAATGLGKLGHWPAAGALAERLRDSSWDVRRAAGLALRALGAPGMLLLRRALSDGDRFASDMAQQVLEIPDGRQQPRPREPAVDLVSSAR
jgi:HEAT repeats